MQRPHRWNVEAGDRSEVSGAVQPGEQHAQLPDELKVDGKAVIFSGELQSDSTMVKKPAPNDVPVDDFKARNIKILSIEEG